MQKAYVENDSHIPIVDLFPYKIQNRNNFLFRDHPEGIDPDSPQYTDYWAEQLRHYIEGQWIYDGDTWVFLPPKLDFYANYAKIEDKHRNIRHPDLRDVEWIIFTYLLGVDGFSGFELDEEYTCHFTVEAFEKGEDLDEVQLSLIPEEARIPDGSGFKKFIHPWEYLTKHYLIDNKAANPLGRALFQNNRFNGLMLTARGLGKSLSCFVGDMGHELLTSGIKRFEDVSNLNMRLNFFGGCADAGQLNRSIKAFRQFYYNQPGQYSTLDESGDEIKYWGALFKNLQGEWGAKGGSSLQHVVKDRSGKPVIQGSILEFRPIGEGAYGVSAGDRFRRIYAEESGLMDVLEFYRFNKDSIKVGNERVGSLLGLGTSGDMVKVQAAAKMLFNPEAYDLFSIPDYWRNPEKRMGLFIPTPYKYGEYKDENGNTKIELAYQRFFKERLKLRQESDSASYDKEVMHNPGTPDELLRPSDNSLMPKAEARSQQSFLEAFDVSDRFAIGEFEWDALAPNGIRFKKDMSLTKKPIVDYYTDKSKIDIRGVPIVYEFPNLEYTPSNLYWVIYDPAAKSGDGESYHSVLVYKYFYSGDENSMYDTIVAEWIGRYQTLEENYEQVIKIAKFFNARIFPEVNVSGFVDWCKRNEYWHMLEPDAYYLEQEIHGHKAIKRSYYQVGYQMNERKKFWCDQKIAGWLLEAKAKDPVTGAPTLRTMDWIFSLRLLDEIVHYDPKGNFDHISSLRGLMLLLGKLERDPILLERPEDQTVKDHADLLIYKPEEHQFTDRPSLLNY